MTKDTFLMAVLCQSATLSWESGSQLLDLNVFVSSSNRLHTCFVITLVFKHNYVHAYCDIIAIEQVLKSDQVVNSIRTRTQ